MAARGDRWRNAAPIAAILAVVALAPVLMGGSAEASVPRSMAALGDSFTAATFSGAPCSPSVSCPQNSWSTGTTPAISSHLQRLRAMDSTVAGFSFAVSARKVSDLGRQAQLAVAQRVEYVTVMLGLNDSCRETEAAMTPVSTFRAQFSAGLTSLTQGLPNARVLVASIPDIERLRTLFAGNAAARTAWSQQQVCQVLLADPQSTAPDDVARRSRARQRVIDFNRQLAEVCAQHANCRYDGGAVFRWAFGAADFVTRDYFHLSAKGQAGLAAVTWAAGFDFGPDPPPPAGGYAAVVRADEPAAYWRLGDRSGTLAAAAVGPAGRYVGGFGLGQAGALAGDADTAVLLNGSSGYVTAPHSAPLSTGDRFTLEAWVRRRTTGQTQGLISKGTRAYQLFFDTAGRIVLRQPGVGDVARSTVALTDLTAFHHLAVTKDGPAVRIYVDGVDRTQVLAARTIASSTSQLVIGAGAGYLNGTLDEVAIYPRALSAAAVARHRAAGLG